MKKNVLLFTLLCVGMQVECARIEPVESDGSLGEYGSEIDGPSTDPDKIDRQIQELQSVQPDHAVLRRNADALTNTSTRFQKIPVEHSAPTTTGVTGGSNSLMTTRDITVYRKTPLKRKTLVQKLLDRLSSAKKGLLDIFRGRSSKNIRTEKAEIATLKAEVAQKQRNLSDPYAQWRRPKAFKRVYSSAEDARVAGIRNQKNQALRAQQQEAAQRQQYLREKAEVKSKAKTYRKTQWGSY